MLSIKMGKGFKPFKKNWWNLAKKEWTPQLMSDNRDLWPLQVSAEGKPWKVLSPSYQKWKTEVYGSMSILRVTGEMTDRASLKVRGNKFVVTTTKEGVYNQFGTDRMPARPWMGIPSKSLNKLSEISLKYILS